MPEIQLFEQPSNRWAVASALPPDSILVEFVRFDVFNFHAVPAKVEAQWHPAHYLAFVLPVGQPDAVQMVDLGEVEPIDDLIRLFRQASDNPDKTLAWGKPALVPKLQDKATALLMDRFFDNLQRGMGRAEALQNAQNYIRKITVKELRQSALGIEVLKKLLGVNELSPKTSIDCQEDTPLEHPFYWGAWICQGDTTPYSVLPFNPSRCTR